MKYETKISYHLVLLVVGNIASAAVVSCLQGAPKVSCFTRDFAKNLIVFFKGSPLHYEYCVILIYRLKVSDRAGDVQVTFVFRISCVGVSVFSLLKKC